MSPACYEALEIPLGDAVVLLLEDDAVVPSGGTAVWCEELPDGWRAYPSSRTLDAAKPADRPPFCFEAFAPERGLNALRIFELRDYSWRLIARGGALPANVTLDSSLRQSADRDLWKDRQGHGRFRFVNYLGSAWIEAVVPGQPPVRIAFDVASPKLDYDQEYRSMVEAIGEDCQQLLLEWGTPTTLNLTLNPEQQAQTLLEQFLFLRHVLGADKLELYLEVLQRRPHSRLEIERNWKPSGAAEPSTFARDPLRHGRGWQQGAAGFMPEEIREERKFDSLDTPPNRFVKFALQSFSSLCDAVLSAKRSGKPAWNPQDTVCLEAASLQHALDAFLALPVFDDVGELRCVPFESTTLQRSEGYREILLAWLMLGAAAQIEWPGREDVYDGTTRDVATLYEYWLYFLLVRAFRKDLGMVPEQDPVAIADDALPFCCRASDGRLIINLRKGKDSFCRFQWQQGERHLRVHFFYNRSFGRAAVGERGSYSKTFRPDYTLVIIPEEFDAPNWHDAERAAEKSGRIAYLHFDAKYRGENLPGLFGTAEREDDNSEDERSRASSIVKNADLYKMHTYNEAIRRTVGSYVLYPGVAPNPNDANARFARYHEVVPGIGAFAIRPGKSGEPPHGLPFLLDFIGDILAHQLSLFTQSYRISYWTETTLREAPPDYQARLVDFPFEAKPPKDTQVLLGYVRDDEGASVCCSTKSFFCHAVEWSEITARSLDGSGVPGEPSNLNFDPFRSDLLVTYHHARSSSWVAKVLEVRLVSAAERAAETGRDLKEMNASYYYRFQLGDFLPTQSRDVSSIVPVRSGKPVARWLNDFAACPVVVQQGGASG